jgi:hypothetical protein
MADVSTHTPVFSRGSTVLDYWLAHAEGLTVQPLGARVEKVVVVAPVGRAESLIVRSRMTRRRMAIPAESIAAVEPSTGNLLLDAAETGPGLRIPRPSPERVAAARASVARGGGVARANASGAARGARAGTQSALVWLRPRAMQAGATIAHGGGVARANAAGAARGARAGTISALAWLRPRAVQAGATIARFSRLAAMWTARGIAWLAPRVAAGVRIAVATGARLTLAAAVVVARGAARTARELERAAAAAAERGRASLEARRARQQLELGDRDRATNASPESAATTEKRSSERAS